MLIDVKRLLPDPLQLVVLGEACTVNPDVSTDVALKFKAAAEVFQTAARTGEIQDPSLIYSLLSAMLERPRRFLRPRRFTPARLKRGLGLQSTVALLTAINVWLNQTSVDIAREAVQNPQRAMVR
jgi:hypothetical protein